MYQQIMLEKSWKKEGKRKDSLLARSSKEIDFPSCSSFHLILARQGQVSLHSSELSVAANQSPLFRSVSAISLRSLLKGSRNGYIPWLKDELQGLQDGDWDRVLDLVSSWTRDPVETLEAHLAEVKHQREPKIWHSKPLDHGRLLHTMI
jgi:hypothetical protein